jgi:hypothetical protein
MPRPDYASIGKAIERLGTDSDILAGKALDQIEWLLDQGGSSWAKLGKEVAGLGARASTQAGPQTPRGNGDRPPSQWKQDRDAVVRAYERRDELDAWAGSFLESIHTWCVEDNKGLTPAQREKLFEQMDKLGL